jgi:hypothetical protein
VQPRTPQGLAPPVGCFWLWRILHGMQMHDILEVESI